MNELLNYVLNNEMDKVIATIATFVVMWFATERS